MRVFPKSSNLIWLVWVIITMTTRGRNLNLQYVASGKNGHSQFTMYKLSIKTKLDLFMISFKLAQIVSSRKTPVSILFLRCNKSLFLYMKVPVYGYSCSIENLAKWIPKMQSGAQTDQISLEATFIWCPYKKKLILAFKRMSTFFLSEDK